MRGDNHKPVPGDARRALNLLEVAAGLAESAGTGAISSEHIDEVVSGSVRRFDHGGDVFYDQISALQNALSEAGVEDQEALLEGELVGLEEGLEEAGEIQSLP